MTMHPLQQFDECYASCNMTYIVECCNYIASGNMNVNYICQIIVIIQFIQRNLDLKELLVALALHKRKL